MNTDELGMVVEAWAMQSNLRDFLEYTKLYGGIFDPINNDSDCALLLYELNQTYHVCPVYDLELDDFSNGRKRLEYWVSPVDNRAIQTPDSHGARYGVVHSLCGWA